MNIFERNATRNFFIENGSYADRKAIMTLTESDMSQVSTNLVAKLYRSAVEKGYIDFDDIPSSKGDITKYKGYADMMEALDLVDAIARSSNIKITETDVVRRAVGNIIAMRDIYTKGFALGNDFIIMNYNTMVLGCVESTSGIIASFVDYVKSVDNISFKIINRNTSSSASYIRELERFNEQVASGDFPKALKMILNTNNGKGVVKESALVITAAVLTTLVAVVVLMRQIVFKVYHCRMKLADYLKMQAMFLEMNRANIEAKESKVPPAKRKQIIKKQHELAEKLTKLADKLKVDYVSAETKAHSDMKAENTMYTLDTLQTNPGLDRVELL